MVKKRNKKAWKWQKPVIVGIIVMGILIVTVVMMMFMQKGNKENISDSLKTSILSKKGNIIATANISEEAWDDGKFYIEIHANEIGESLGSFEFKLLYDSKLFEVDYSEGVDGVSTGSDTDGYVIVSAQENADSPGVHFFSGMVAKSTKKLDQRVHIANVHLKVSKKPVVVDFSEIKITKALLYDEKVRALKVFDSKPIKIQFSGGGVLRTTKGICGSAAGIITGNVRNSEDMLRRGNLCSEGILSGKPFSPKIRADQPRSWLWKCSGINGGAATLCKATEGERPDLMGKCGPAADGSKTYDKQPTVGLCERGSVSGMQYLKTSPPKWTWVCGDVIQSSHDSKLCVAHGEGKTENPIDGKCGDIKDVFKEDDSKLCKRGVASKVATLEGGNIQATWVCKGLNGGVDSRECKTLWAERCGDGIIQKESGEQCDDGMTGGANILLQYGDKTKYKTCDSKCQIVVLQAPYCGDGNRDRAYGEQCDLGDKNGVIPNSKIGQSQKYCKQDCRTGVVAATVAIRADVNQDSKIDAKDALLILKKTVGYKISNLEKLGWKDTSTTGDVNCDGRITAGDALLVLKKSVNYPDKTLIEMGWCVKRLQSSGVNMVK